MEQSSKGNKMLEKRRNAYEILQEIVEACLEPIESTALYFKIRTSNRVLTSKVNIALRLKLLENSRNKYMATQKGRAFLKAWAKVQTFLKEQ